MIGLSGVNVNLSYAQRRSMLKQTRNLEATLPSQLHVTCLDH
jgi:hypothetical protein